MYLQSCFYQSWYTWHEFLPGRIWKLKITWKSSMFSGAIFSMVTSSLCGLKTSWNTFVSKVKNIWFSYSVSAHNRNFVFGTIHLRRRQIFTIFDPYPPTIGVPAKCLWRGFLILMYCDLLTISTWGHPSPPKTCWRLKWMVPFCKYFNSRQHRLKVRKSQKQFLLKLHCSKGKGKFLKDYCPSL